MQKFNVLRGHLGDRPYSEGEVREAKASDVAHLVKTGVLKPVSKAKGSDAAPKNKSVSAAGKNKGKAGS